MRNFPISQETVAQLEKEAHFHFTVEAFSELLKTYSPEDVVKAMSDDAFWKLRKWFQDEV